MSRLVTAGDPVRHEDVNAGIRADQKLARVRGGHGISVRNSDDGLLIALLDGGKDWVIKCRITAAPPYGVPVLPSLCRYSVKSHNRRFTMTLVYPTYGRQVENDEVGVYPAKVGALCAVLRNRINGVIVPELWVFRENIYRGPC